MGIENVIKVIENLFEWTLEELSDDVKEITINSLKRRIPMAVDYSELNYSGLPVAKCPCCKSKVINSLFSSFFCPVCGQSLDWED